MNRKATVWGKTWKVVILMCNNVAGITRKPPQAHSIPDKTSTTGIHLESPLIREYTYQNALASVFQNNESQRLFSSPPRQESSNELFYSVQTSSKLSQQKHWYPSSRTLNTKISPLHQESNNEFCLQSYELTPKYSSGAHKPANERN